MKSHHNYFPLKAEKLLFTVNIQNMVPWQIQSNKCIACFWGNWLKIYEIAEVVFQINLCCSFWRIKMSAKGYHICCNVIKYLNSAAFPINVLLYVNNKTMETLYNQLLMKKSYKVCMRDHSFSLVVWYRNPGYRLLHKLVFYIDQSTALTF